MINSRNLIYTNILDLTYLSSIRLYLQNTNPVERVWTIFKVQDIANNQLANYILSVAINPQNQGE